MENLAGTVLNYGIKVMAAGSAFGRHDVVFIVANDDMPKDLFFAQKVIGLTLNSLPGGETWLYVAPTRQGNRAMWKHYFSNFLIPLIKAEATIHQHMKDDNGDCFRTTVSMDNEAVILQQVLDPDVLAQFAAANTDVFNTTPSGTAYSQPWDGGSMFRWGLQI